MLLEQLDGAPRPPGRVTTALQLAGLDVTEDALLLHDGMQAHLYTVNKADNSVTELSQFESPGAPSDAVDSAGSGVAVASCVGRGCSMALYSDSVYRTADHKVEVCSFSGKNHGCLFVGGC